MDRRTFLKKLGMLPVAAAAVPIGMMVGPESPESSGAGSIIVEAGAEDTLVNGNSLQGGDIIVKKGAKRTMITNTLLTREDPKPD